MKPKGRMISTASPVGDAALRHVRPECRIERFPGASPHPPGTTWDPGSARSQPCDRPVPIRFLAVPVFRDSLADHGPCRPSTIGAELARSRFIREPPWAGVLNDREGGFMSPTAPLGLEDLGREGGLPLALVGAILVTPWTHQKDIGAHPR